MRTILLLLTSLLIPTIAVASPAYIQQSPFATGSAPLTIENVELSTISESAANILLPLAVIDIPAAAIVQNGKNHSANLAQYGLDNRGLIVQQGAGHTASLMQSGAGNIGFIHQTGLNNLATVRQVGSAHSAAVIQQGFNNVAVIRQR